MGRRAYAPQARRRNSLQAYLTDAEYQRVYNAAIKQDKHLSEWFREIVLKEVEKREARA